jgi:ribosome-associated toxin RatA of RatAB toxin-antitoxin module
VGDRAVEYEYEYEYEYDNMHDIGYLDIPRRNRYTGGILRCQERPVPSFSHTVPVRASVATVWLLVRDVRRVAGLFPYVDVEGFDMPTPDHWLFWRRLRIPTLAEMRWQEEAWVAEDHVLAFRAVQGDMRTFYGTWTVAPDDAGASLTLDVTYEIPEGIAPPSVPVFVAQHVLGEVMKTICARIQEAAEEDEEA